MFVIWTAIMTLNVSNYRECLTMFEQADYTVSEIQDQYFYIYEQDSSVYQNRAISLSASCATKTISVTAFLI